MVCNASAPKGREGSALRYLPKARLFGRLSGTLSLSNKMHESSKNHPPEADDFEKAGLTPAPCEVVQVPRVGEAGVSMECVLDRVLPFGTDHLVIGRMVRFYVQDELYQKNGRIDAAGLDPLGRLAGNYTRIETIFELPTDDLRSE
jgi:flavin reductase (DIM6/NTAB) family NADH-FMN oxidoreductase RutF